MTTLATAGVVVSSHLVESSPVGVEMVQVVVSEVDIPRRTDLDELIKVDEFRIIQVPEGVVVKGAITSIDELRDAHNRVVILAGEQIPVARIKDV